MSAPLDHQTAMRRFALGRDAPDAAALAARFRGEDAEAMLAIHRNTVRLTLRGALAANFPAVAVLVGEGFFATAADAFIAQHPPTDPRLGLYGDGFDTWLAAHPGLAAYPFVPEVARFELACARAWRSEPADTPDDGVIRAFAAASATLEAVLHPSATLLRAAHRVQRIHTAALSKGTLDDADVRPSATDLLVLRRRHAVAVEPLSAAEATALEDVLNGRACNPADLARAIALGAFAVSTPAPATR